MKVAIIGGGASGLCAAISAGTHNASVSIFEKENRVGKKLLKTGNGRCNLSNQNINQDGYNHPDFVAFGIDKIGCNRLVDIFKSFGLFTYSDSEGRVYPISDNSSSVLDVLRLECAKLNVKEITESEIVEIIPQKNGGFNVIDKNKNSYFADKVIISTGGGTELLRSLGHKIIPFQPVLCPIKTDTFKIRGLSGLRVKCNVKLMHNGKTVTSEAGEVMFRDYGLSGIVIFNISRFAKNDDVISLDLLPEISYNDLCEIIDSRPFDGENILTGVFHKRISEALLKNSNKNTLAKNIKDFQLKVTDVSDKDNAQVTRGGCDIALFNNKTFESTIYPGLYCTGEALDIDGKCGGFNLHWAFISGLIAGEEATK